MFPPLWLERPLTDVAMRSMAGMPFTSVFALAKAAQRSLINHPYTTCRGGLLQTDPQERTQNHHCIFGLLTAPDLARRPTLQDIEESVHPGSLKRRLTAWRSSTPHPKCTSLCARDTFFWFLFYKQA